MATTSQVNIVNISNLPETQQVFDGNYFIVQNSIGTQIVDYANLGVLYLDVNGNGTYAGSITGNDISLSTATIGSLTSTQFFSSGQAGQTNSLDYYNLIQTTNGLTTSAYYKLGSPEYNDIIQNQLPALTANLLSSYQANYTSYSIPFYFDNTGNAVVVFTPLPGGVVPTDFSPADFSLAQYDGSVPALSTFRPLFYNITTGGNPAALQITVNVNQPNLCLTCGTPTQFVVKASIFYNA